jgi:hypothetical protein
MSDWVRCSTREQAIGWLDQQLDRAANEAHDTLVREGLGEEEQAAGMEKVYAALDRAREFGLAEIERAFANRATVH